jgi:transcriptional regulator with XRE-family HTH domain
MWTQGQLAEEARLSPTTVSGIETGRISRPHFGALRKLARALEVDPQVLLSWEEPIEQESVAPLSLDRARSAEEDFEQELEGLHWRR